MAVRHGSEIEGVGASSSAGGWDRVIIGIDPGTNVMGYGILGVNGKKPAMIAMGVIKLSRFDDHYMRLRHIHQRVAAIIASYLPDEMAIEAPFYGKNVQSMLKLGRAQGVAMSAALERDIPIAEYEEMLRRILGIDREMLMPQLDATDALGAALCHFYESQRPAAAAGPKSWKEFIARNPGRVK